MRARFNLKIVFFVSLLFTAVFLTSVEVFADATSEINNSAISQAQYKKYITTPYSVKDLGERTIDPITGDMEIKTTDLSLKGKNGLDFNLTRYYSLQQANMYNFVYNEQERSIGRELFTLNDKLYDLGTGWAFDIPFIVVDGVIPRELHMGSKGVLYTDVYRDEGVTKAIFDRATNSYFFSNYKLKDMILKLDLKNGSTGSFDNGQSNLYVAKSQYLVEKKDGKKYYFNSSGYLIGETDRFGNSIKFQYNTHANDNTRITTLSRIIDSVGREINFGYDDTNHKLTVSVYGDGKMKSIIYQKQPIGGTAAYSEYYLQSVTDAENRVTTYNYTFNLFKADLNNKNIGDNNGELNYYACLEKVTYPSGNFSYFVYKIYTKNIGQTGSVQFYKVSNALDTNGDYTKDTGVNKVFFYNNDHNSWEYDGWPLGTSPSQTTTKILTTSGKFTNMEQCEFNEKYQCTSLIKTGEDHKIETSNDYDSDGQITKIASKTYNPSTGKYIERIENYYYDIYRDLISYWNSRAEGNTANKEYKTSYQYNQVYHFPVSKTYNKDANTTITEEYTASSDNKTISYFRVKENDVLKKQAQYLYDSCGNVIEERNYLDNWSDYISTKYSYDDKARNGQFNGLYLTRKYTEGVNDVNGNAVSARTGNTAGTVDETYTYDWFGNLTQKTDANGNASSYDYDKLGRMTKQINPDSSFKLWQYTTNENENSVLMTDENNKKFKCGYDKLGNLIYAQDVTSGEYLNQYSYDSNLQLTEEKNNTSSQNYKTIYYEYTSDGQIKLKLERDKNSNHLYEEEYTYDDAYVDAVSGNKYEKVTKKINIGANSPGIVTSIYTNKYGVVEKTSSTHNGTEYFDTFKYDYLGNKVEEKSAKANSKGWTQPWTAKYEYNYAGKPVKVYNINGDYTSTVYDALGRTASVSDIKGIKAAVKYSSTYTYDKLGRVIEESVPFSKNNSGTIIPSIKRNYYDRNGNLTTVEQSSNKPGEAQAFNQTDYEYNNRNLLSKVTTYDASRANYTQYYYDAVGNKIRMYTGQNAALTLTGPDVATTGSVTKYEYNQFGQLTKMTEPLGKEENYQYDYNGNMLSKTDRNGNITTNSYDALNRLLSASVATPDGKGDTSHTYTYGLNGLRTTMDGISYTYDDLGRLKTETDGAIVKEYDYDAANNRISLIIKQNGTVKTSTTYDYDNMNRLEKVSENNQLIAKYHYDENGNRDTLTNANGTSTVYSYNLANKLATLTNNKGTTPLSKYTYSYYLNGNQASKTDLAGKVTSYLYDGLGRLSSEAPSGEPTISYTYDDYNNRLTMTVAGVSRTEYAYDKNNRLLTETKTAGTTTETTNYNYDENGNQISKATETLKPADASATESIEVSTTDDSAGGQGVTLNEYNGFNQLVKTTSNGTTAVYTYNGDGQRISKTVNGTVTNHIWDGDQIALETDSAGTVTNKYVRGINLLYAENTAGNKQYYLFNGHGDVVQLTGTDGSVTKNYDYDAFGNEKNPDAGDTNVFRYCGEYFDLSSGTYYLRARYYDPEIGQFITEDSYWGKDSDPLSLNLYTYCYNNGVNYYDPSGHFGFGDVWNGIKGVGSWFKGGWDSYQEWGDRLEAENALDIAKMLLKIRGITPNDKNYTQELIKEAMKNKEMTDYINESLIMGYCGTVEIGTTKIASLIKNDKRLIRFAEAAGKNEALQKEINTIVEKLIAGNGNPGKGSKNLFKGVNYLRTESGGRVFYRIKNGVVEILAKADKSNEKFVIKVLEELYK
jgi:RHS repeat-associated protein